MTRLAIGFISADSGTLGRDAKSAIVSKFTYSTPSSAQIREIVQDLPAKPVVARGVTVHTAQGEQAHFSRQIDAPAFPASENRALISGKISQSPAWGHDDPFNRHRPSRRSRCRVNRLSAPQRRLLQPPSAGRSGPPESPPFPGR